MKRSFVVFKTGMSSATSCEKKDKTRYLRFVNNSNSSILLCQQRSLDTGEISVSDTYNSVPDLGKGSASFVLGRRGSLTIQVV